MNEKTKSEVFFQIKPREIPQGGQVRLRASGGTPKAGARSRVFHWKISGGYLSSIDGTPLEGQTTSCDLGTDAEESAGSVLWNIEEMRPGIHLARVSIYDYESPLGEEPSAPPISVIHLPRAEDDREITVRESAQTTKETVEVLTQRDPIQLTGNVRTTLAQSARAITPDEAFWILIRQQTKEIGFPMYFKYMNDVFEGLISKDDIGKSGIELPYPRVRDYRTLKAATETFLEMRVGVVPDFSNVDARREFDRAAQVPGAESLDELWAQYVEEPTIRKASMSSGTILPYLSLIRDRLGEVGDGVDVKSLRMRVQERLRRPVLIELIWSYWHEEGMQAQTMLALAQRFQNRASGPKDPLANLEIDPLRLLNNLFWGYIQDEQHRLSVRRRDSEYRHQYGIGLHGQALRGVLAADSRTKFIESFHTLLAECHRFYAQDANTTMVADAFPVLNALKETHYVLAFGAHNQYGDLPSTARQEMLIEQWLLSRPEVREFLGGRVMVPYPEQWMDRVDSMKTLQGWTDTSIVHFHDLAVFGEQVLLSVRFGNWSRITDPVHAANWARYWQSEIKGYTHAYRSATGVDLSLDPPDAKQAAARREAPSIHLLNRLNAQKRL